MELEIQTVKLVIILQAFLKDLHMLQLQSETEKVWVKQAEHMILEAENAIDIFISGRPNQVRWLWTFGHWIARHELKMEMKHVQTELNKLLERKERYDFKFIYTDASKLLLHRNPLTLEDTNLNDISSAVSKISTRLSNLPPMRKQVINEIKPLQDQLNHLYKLFNDAAGELLFNSRKLGLEQVKNIAQVAESSIELKTYMEEGRPKYLKGIEPIKRTIFLLDRTLTVCHIEQNQSRSVIGLEEDVHVVLFQLTTGEETCLISIQGMEGIGKTTLAKEVYHHRTILKHFPVRAWVNVFQVRKLFKQQNADQSPIRKFWIEKLRKQLAGGDGPYLLVLDRITSTTDWDMLREVLPQSLNGTNGSRILLTTRYDRESIYACENVRSGGVIYWRYYVRLRTKEQSWKLYKQMLRLLDEQIEPREKNLNKKVVGRCGGLPLSIVTLAYKKRVADELHRALERFNQGWGQGPWFNNLESNFTVPHTETSFFGMTYQTRMLNHETTFLLEYLSYLRLFPRDFEIPARRVVALSLAEGILYLDNPDIATSSECALVEEHLLRLINLNLIQIVEGKFGGKTKTCCLPGVVGELILRYKDIRSQYGIKLNKSLQGRIVDNYDNNDESFEHIHGVDTNSPDVWLKYRDLLSFISTDTREGNKPREDIRNFLNRGIANECFGKLKVLDLERVFRPQLPETIAKLIELRYLGLRWTYIEEIPSCIGNLYNLKTLDLKHTHIRNLPITIWKMLNLQHLYLDQIYRGVFLYEPKTGSLKNLQTLWGAFLDERSPLLQSGNHSSPVVQLQSLTKLGLTIQLERLKQKDLAKWVANLINLQCLRLRSINHGGKPQALHLEPLSRLKNLCSLNLCGNLESISISNYFPETLTDLTLSATNLQNDPMQDLMSFTNLRSLCLYSDSFMGEGIVCSFGLLPQLNILKIWKLKALKKLDILEQAMPSLWELEIRSCHLLEVPSGVEHLSNLHELKLRDMPENFTTTIEQNKKQIWSDLHKNPAVTITSPYSPC
ncbi:Disease resistance protein [Quillaja saponaria]|uniref:Disease resistance protein n=1 Tax=Quillaja saponaria TaxID=32244 RepID=A0AAD7PPD7_QUISA|nr:Disease resistance protein [Quillaja saponaria]